MTAAPSSENGTVAAREPRGDAKAPLDLNETVQATVAEARAEWNSYSEFELALDAGLPPVPCVPDRLEGAILTLIENAARATKDVLDRSGTKGTIAISTSQRGDMAEIKVTDNGPGHVGQTGIGSLKSEFDGESDPGLVACRSTIVDQHGGRLEFETEPGVGTTFTVSLPLHIEEEPD